MLSAADFQGRVLALPPTPLRDDVDPLGQESTVDIAEACRAADQMIRDGVGLIGLCGTTGEGATTTWQERVELYDAVKQTAAGRVPVLAGTTGLGTKEVVGQMRAVRDLGLDGAFVGLPLWQTPTLENAIGFHADLAEAVPDLPLLVYANRFFFKFEYPIEFWRGVVDRCPTVVACKTSFPLTDELLAIAGGQVAFLNGEGGLLTAAYKSFPDYPHGCWATSAAMGPQPWVAAMSAAAAGDRERAIELLEAIDAVPLPVPDWTVFPQYNIQFEKARIDAAGYMRCGRPRPPYTDLPQGWRDASVANAAAWRELCASTTGVSTS
ncbi:MAG: trans-o-hydroxybenzylidenepyruvate hydratase-aldolase [Mycobacterium sp.]|nr:trans-o-hydroxybenzylidenepyruvate hydratase-aldolase [Mycobacterium sp.]